MDSYDDADVLERLRSRGWSVAVHNDYMQDGRPHTFWLLTHPSGVWAKGEGTTNKQALLVAEEQAGRRMRSVLPRA